jgi:outer membrane protein assembly factor BamB
LSGHDPASGQVLWEQEWIGHSNGDASTSQPNFLPGDRMLMTKGYGVGAALFQFEQTAGDKLQLTEVWRNARVLRTKLTSAVVLGDHAYGLSDGILECIEWSTGKSRWKKRGFEHGQILLVGDQLIILSESGELALVDASPAAFVQRGGFQALEGKTWNTICLHGRLLLIRNGQEAGCWELP